MNGVGHSPQRVDAADKVVGSASYPADRIPPDALVAKVVFTDQPHARLISLDVGAAEATPGVVAVFTGADVPVNEYGLTLFDQPVFVTVDHTGRSDVPGDVSRWEADHLALVVAESIEAADAGAAAIDARWEPLPIVGDLDDALAMAAPLLHPENGLDTRTPTTATGSARATCDAGWAAAAAVVEGDL